MLAGSTVVACNMVTDTLALMVSLVVKKQPRPERRVKNTALILSGGGARAAYQVGVLKAISEMLPKSAHNPFGIICGTSAGALNATAIAAHAARFRAGVLGLESIWRNLRAEQVYRTDIASISQRSLKRMGALFMGRHSSVPPISLLDNQPLRELIGRVIHFGRIAEGIEQGDLRALSITASGYATGESVSFYQGAPDIRPWRRRSRRLGVPTILGPEHLMASSAIPVVFPAVRIGPQYFGDGSVRQLAPISPALHLGADRVLVIGVSASNEIQPPTPHAEYPSVAQILGHMLNSAFVDSLEGDVERLERINRTLDLIPEERQREASLRRVNVLNITPSQPLDAISGRHVRELPRSLGLFLRGSGATEHSGSAMLSYLLFAEGYCRELITLGYHDAMRRERQILHFLGYEATVHLDAADLPAHDIC